MQAKILGFYAEISGINRVLLKAAVIINKNVPKNLPLLWNLPITP